MFSDVRMPTKSLTRLHAISSDVRMPTEGLIGLPAMSSDVRMPAVGLNRGSPAIVQFSYRWESKRNTARLDRSESLLLEGETLDSCDLVISSSTEIDVMLPGSTMIGSSVMNR